MSQHLYLTLKNSVSDIRLHSHKAHQSNSTCLELISLYFYNIQLSESLYPTLNFFEVSLRNSMYEAFKTEFNRADWYNQPNLFNGKLLAQLTEVKSRLSNKGIQQTPNQIISELTLGFWVGLFNSAYEQMIWRRYPNLLKLIFPKIPKKYRQRIVIANRLNPIRDLRNRVFHHEPILLMKDLDKIHQTIYDVLNWQNPNVIQLLKSIDRFQELRRNKINPTKQLIFRNFISFEDIYALP